MSERSTARRRPPKMSEGRAHLGARPRFDRFLAANLLRGLRLPTARSLLAPRG